MPKAIRPPGVEWEHDRLSELPHGTPLLTGGLLLAASRDASFLDRPDVYTIKASHIVVVSHRLAVGAGVICETAACDPARIMIDTGLIRDAVKIHPNGRCRRAGCRRLFALADAEAASIERIRATHGLSVHGGMRVAYEDRPGVIVGYQGEYLRVLLDGDSQPVTCHPTDRMKYPQHHRPAEHTAAAQRPR